MACPRCAKDPARRASYRCQCCGAPVCEACTVNARFCSVACNRRYGSFFRRFGAGLRRRVGLPVTEGGGLGRAVLGFLLALALGAALVVGLHARGAWQAPAPVGPAIDRVLGR